MCVNIRDTKDWDIFIEIADRNGFVVADDTLLPDNYEGWYKYGQETCVDVSKKQVTFGYKRWFERQGYTILILDEWIQIKNYH